MMQQTNLTCQQVCTYHFLLSNSFSCGVKQQPMKMKLSILHPIKLSFKPWNFLQRFYFKEQGLYQYYKPKNILTKIYGIKFCDINVFTKILRLILIIVQYQYLTMCIENVMIKNHYFSFKSNDNQQFSMQIFISTKLYQLFSVIQVFTFSFIINV